MSTPWTGAAQVERLRERGLQTAWVPALRDVDRFDDAVAVSKRIPQSRFAAEVRRSLRQPVLARAGS
jgi:glycosyltransferase A (GT-A) superfamily protein (DUF2064 family)